MNVISSSVSVRTVATCVPRGMTGTSGLRRREPERDVGLGRGRREERDADQLEELDVDPVGHPVEPVEQLVGHPGEQLDQRHAGVGDVVVGPLRAALLDEPLGVVDEVLEAAVVEVRAGRAWQASTAPSASWRIAPAGSRRTGRRGCAGRWCRGCGSGCRCSRRPWSAASNVDDDVVDVDPRLPALAAHGRTSSAISTGRRRVGRREDVVVDRAAELGAHRPLARRRAEDQPRWPPRSRARARRARRAGRVDAERKREPGADELVRRRHLASTRTFMAPSRIVSGGPTQVQSPPMTAAGRPEMRTVSAPGGRIGPPTCGTTVASTRGHACMSPTSAAGSPPMSTLGAPGPTTVPPCAVMSPTLAAGGISSP